MRKILNAFEISEAGIRDIKYGNKDSNVLGINISYPIPANKAKSLVSAFKKFFKELENDLYRKDKFNLHSSYGGDLGFEYSNTKINKITDNREGIEKDCYAQINLFTSGYYYEKGGTLSKDEILKYLYSKLPREYVHYKGDTYFKNEENKNPLEVDVYYNTRVLDPTELYLVRDSFYIVARIKYMS